jgi:alpha-L-fucosidase
MAWATRNHLGIARAGCGVVLALSFLACPSSPMGAAAPSNLALNKPACSSSIENEEHNAAQANDGDPATWWCADDEPEGGPEWWQVDLQKPCDLSGCQIRWPFQGQRYRYKVEGSTDRKNWSLLSDQTHTTATVQVHNLKFQKARQARYVKITVTGLDDGCWVSISEVKVFGSGHSAGAHR